MELPVELDRAVSVLKAGGLVAFPTETVYGLGADATNPRAVARIFEAKGRPRFDPLIVHIASVDDAEEFVTELPDAARQLAEAFWPGPLTLVLPKRSCIPDLVTSGLPGVGIRVPRHPLAAELLRRYGRPLAAPSANPFSGISPTTADHVNAGLGDSVDLILDGGPCEVGLESTVVSFMEGSPVLLRPGGCCLEDIEKVVGRIPQRESSSRPADSAQPSPGMLDRHYAPRTPLLLIDRDEVAVPADDLACGLLSDGTRRAEAGFTRRIDLSPDGNLLECAAQFFGAMRELDDAGLDRIIAHRFPDHGLGLALNDRLRRAAFPLNKAIDS